MEICKEDYVAQGYCNSTDIGEFVVAHNATEKSNSVILTRAIHLKDTSPIRYAIKKTGYYCLATQGYNTEKYNAVVEFRNAYGELAATQIPKMPFYGVMSILYVLMAGYWGFLYYQHRHDIRKRYTPRTSSPHPLTWQSRRSKLHHGYPDIPVCRNANYLGILR